MNRVNFTDYDIKPEGMVNYIRYYGPHFNRKLCEFAVSKMTKENGKPIDSITKERVDKIL